MIGLDFIIKDKNADFYRDIWILALKWPRILHCPMNFNFVMVSKSQKCSLYLIAKEFPFLFEEY